MASEWSATDLATISAADEVRIATMGADLVMRPAVPIWVVVADGGVFVRTWRRRDSGWFGRAVRSGTAHVSLASLEVDVTIDDVRAQDRDSVDAAYRAKYGRYGAATVERMVGDAAAATTLRVLPQ